jgi:hypothetical protein
MDVANRIHAHAIGHPRPVSGAIVPGAFEKATQHDARHIGSGYDFRKGFIPLPLTGGVRGGASEASLCYHRPSPGPSRKREG